MFFVFCQLLFCFVYFVSFGVFFVLFFFEINRKSAQEIQRKVVGACDVRRGQFRICLPSSRCMPRLSLRTFPPPPPQRLAFAPSCPVLSCPVLSCPVLSCPVLLCPVLPCPALSCPAPPCPVPSSHLLLSSPLLSCPVRHVHTQNCIIQNNATQEKSDAFIEDIAGGLTDEERRRLSGKLACFHEGVGGET